MIEFVEVKTSDLTGAALDFGVALAVGLVATGERVINGPILVSDEVDGLQREFSPSTEWAHGGTLLEKNSWCLPYRAVARYHLGKFESCTTGGFPHNGNTPLIAACRAIVAANIGELVQVPVDLVAEIDG